MSTISLEKPLTRRLEWLQGVLGLSDPEMETALDINSTTTLSRWKRDPDDREARELKRFDRLLALTQAASRVMEPRDLSKWLREPNDSMGGITPAKVLGDPRSLDLVIATLEAATFGLPS